MPRGVFTPEDVAGTLKSLCRGQGGRREGEQVRTVFKSIGTDLEDLAAAILMYEG
jgi:ornithine cyclodeaminase/alanine dehydrogenase-like protein (mu-crystallin family)